MRLAIGICILAAQIVQIGVARFHPMRYYCWAPFDSQNSFEVRASIGDRVLSPPEFRARYRVRPRGINPRSIYEITSVITYVETHYAREKAVVTVTYRTNGGPLQQWHWPLR